MSLERNSSTDLSSELDPETANHSASQCVDDNLKNKNLQNVNNNSYLQVPTKDNDLEDEEEYEHELITESNRLLLHSSKLELESIELRSRASAIENMFDTSIKQITSSLKRLEQNSEKLDFKKNTKDPETEENKVFKILQQIKSDFKAQSILTTNLLTETGGVNSGLKAMTTEILSLKKSAKTIQRDTEKVLQKLDEIDNAAKINLELLQDVLSKKNNKSVSYTDLNSVNITETNLQHMKKTSVETKPLQPLRTRTTRIRKPLQQRQINGKIDIKKTNRNKNLKLQNKNNSISDKQKRILIPLDFLNI